MRLLDYALLTLHPPLYTVAAELHRQDILKREVIPPPEIRQVLRRLILQASPRC
jgi:hypothetical protein